ncbi:molybdate ABC transporter substrate-binding protein [Brevibacillus ginsengisoli]|uniref:molybdate ABC transporter substrate-binding protein n=1 Tax=Brevibacillus ginsengisoli TaxID=363854 RepID=UPI003CEEE060
MFTRLLQLGLAACLLLIPVGCGNVNPQSSQPAPVQTNQPDQSSLAKSELIIAAAASLTDALKEMKQTFEQENQNITLTYSFGGSGKLAQQITQGAPVDLFLSASKKDMDKLTDNKLVAPESITTIAHNELVLITRKDSPLALHSFEEMNQASIQHLAVGEPNSVPAGRYTKQVLTKLGQWDKLQSKLVFGSDVRQVLTFVESGNADAGVVYASDALVSKNVKVLATAKPEWHDPIVYPGAILGSTTHRKEAETFLHYLQSEKGQAILHKYGFQ